MPTKNRIARTSHFSRKRAGNISGSQNTWGTKPDPNKTAAPYTDQSSTPLVRAALSNPQNALYENHEDALRQTWGNEGDLPSYGEEIWRGFVGVGLRETEAMHNRGIAGAQLVHRVAQGDPGALEDAYQNKPWIREEKKAHQAKMEASRNGIGKPGSPEHQANRAIRGFYQGVGQVGGEALKYVVTRGTTIPYDVYESYSRIYNDYYDKTGKKDISFALKEGSNAAAIYTGAYTTMHSALSRFPFIPAEAKHFLSSVAASHAEDKYAEDTINKKINKNND